MKSKLRSNIMKNICNILLVPILALSFISCSKKPDEAKMKATIISYYEKYDNYKAGDLNLSPDINTPSYGPGMILYKDVKITSLEFINSRNSTDGNSFEVKFRISGSASRYTNMGMNKQHTAVYEIKDKTVSFSNSEHVYTFKKDKYDEWVY